MKLVMALLALALCGCDQKPEPPPGSGWTLVEKGPEDSTYYGIYKRHSEAEHVTFYVVKIQYGYSLTAIRD